jgi:hypothetical protein
MKGVTYFRWYGFSINEGGTPANITILYARPWFKFFFYVYLFGKRFSFLIK